MRAVRFAAAALAPALLACAGVNPPAAPPPPNAVREPEPPRRIVPVPFDAAWTGALAFFAERQLPVETADRTHGTIVSARFDVGSADSAAWIACEKVSTPLFAPAPKTIRVTGVLRAELHAQGDSTIARIALTASALDQKKPEPGDAGSGMVTADCSSTGALESALVARMRGAHPPPS